MSVWDAAVGEGRGEGRAGATTAATGAGPTAITDLQLGQGGPVGPGSDANANGAPPGTNNSSTTSSGQGTGTDGGGGGGEGGQAQQQGGAIGRRTNSLKITGSPQKKLKPPPQLHERSLLVTGSASAAKGHHSSTYRHPEAPPPHRSQSLSVHEHQHQQTSNTQHLRVHLRGGAAAHVQGQRQGPPQQYQPVQPYQFQVPGRGPAGLGVPSLASPPQNRDTIANFNKKHRQTHSSTSALHRQTYWPDNFRNPRHGLGIQHNTTPPTTTTPNNETERPKTRPKESAPAKE
ncbi:uncharacterized protein ColSpa_08358 [Colletotrichum spaethianum]|uniref:Uncharacterized protein n=1 Tax=Colletotrichum spaethianum TaxID=700344 RepID=A0AA37P9L5_9PEZI|nr:uncharacterized protein ColSpa_08358 [Colletotrichum spaethianum]GKT48177.1 hypothetical protein ColSpa_08358 [Colletotrichum spaethianum]